MTNPPCVICLGEILFDCLADQLGRGLEEVESWTAYPGGAPANVACALVKLGTPAAFVGCVGKDEPGWELVQLLQSVGVDSTGIQYHPTAPTRQVYVVRSETGDRSFAGFGTPNPDEFADAYLQSSQLPVKLWQEAEFVVLGTLELAYPQTRSAVWSALQLAEQYDVKVVVDVNWRPMFWRDASEAQPLITQLWKYVDFLKLSDEEAQWLFDTTDAGAIARLLASVEGVLVTAGGEADVSYCLSDNEGKVSPFSMQVQDTTGAGDSFLAGFIHQLCQRGIASLNDPDTAKEIVTYACAVGGLTTTKPGAIASQPTEKEVEQFLKQINH
ncbi:MAG: carbohydrate kinase [Xenococcaceae cyanobacterium]